ncbi:MAG: ThuA domain-containing protein [Salinibacterium sp.]|nr:ThuA domain-containing protein [Salinibacterium sp.]MBF0672388.1 ThuA domain-containing protein [Salinibacterium sp.]
MVDGMKALIASGSGRYADPWHPFPRTSPLIAEVLTAAGFSVEFDDDVDAAMARLDGVDLLVLNAGGPSESGPGTTPQESIDGFASALERGIGILAVHCALSSMPDYPEWASTVGGRWVQDVSWHPPIDTAHVTGLALPDGTPISDFDVFDERYLALEQLEPRHTVAEHHHEGDTAPAAWVREVGASRAAVDTLGHDEKSYESAGRRELMTRLALWAVRA